MARLISLALLVLSLAPAALAATAFTGQPFLVTNTRYAPAYGAPLLLTNDRDVLLFWNSGTRFRATRVASGIVEPSHSILKNGGSDTYAVTWTGSRFLMVVARKNDFSISYDDDIIGQLTDSSGEPVGEPFKLVGNGYNPHIASDGTNVLLTYTAGEEISVLRLTKNGEIIPTENQRTGVMGWIQSLASNGKSYAAVVEGRYDRRLVMFDRNGVVTSTTQLVNDVDGDGLIASDGTRYLLADGALNKLTTQFVETNGTLGDPIDLVPRGAHVDPLALTWSGARWVVAYRQQRYDSSPPSFVVAHLNATTRAVEQLENERGQTASLTARAGRVTLAWIPGSPAGIRIADSPIGLGDVFTASFASTAQRILGTASSSHGTLVLWEEQERVRSGLRGSDGSWRESEVAIGSASEAVAASDGEGFAALVNAVGGLFVQRFDRDGAPAGEPVKLHWYADQILWTGREYLLYHGMGDGLLLATFSKTGVLSPSRIVDIGTGGGSATLASNGDGFYALWGNPWHQYTSPPMPPTGLKGVHLDANLQPVGERIVFLGDDDVVFGGSVAWDGARYVVAWSGWDGVNTVRVPAEGAPTDKQELSDQPTYGARVQSVEGGVIVDWEQDEYTYDPRPQLVFLPASGEATTPTPLPVSDYRLGSEHRRVVALPGGNAAVVESAIVDDAPVDGATRIRMTVVSRNPLPRRPDAPQIMASVQNGVADLRWIAPPPPVSGYRVEYRRDDGAWIELETPIGANQRSVLIDTQGLPLAVRVRAWNDGGPGAYSQVLAVNGKRRAVRLR